MQLTLTLDKAVIADVLTTQAMNIIAELEPTVTQIADQYISKLQDAMGGTNVGGWMPLQPGDDKFWYESGGLEHALAIAFQATETGFSIIAGISPDSPSYDKAIWNEFGFYPHDSDRLIRRPLFVPLAEEQVIELNNLIRQSFSNRKVTLDMRFV